MVEKKNRYLVLMRQSSDELAKRRFFRRFDVKYFYVASALVICQLTTLVCYLVPSWLVVKIGRYTLLLGVWGYCLTIESFQDCEYFYKLEPWDAQSTLLRLFQLMETLLVLINLVSLITIISCKIPCPGAKCRRWNIPSILDLLLVSSGIAAFGGVLAFYITFITYATTDDKKVLTLLNDRRPGWAIIVSIIAYCFMILFSVILISSRSQTSDLGVNDNELPSCDTGVGAEGAYEIVDDVRMPGVKQAEDVTIETYENPSTVAESDDKPVARKDEPIYCLSEVGEKPRELKEKNNMMQIPTKDEDKVSTETLRGDEEWEEETQPCEDRQEEMARRQRQGEEKSSTDSADDRLNAKVLIPDCPSMESLKKKKKKKMKLCCNS